MSAGSDTSLLPRSGTSGGCDNAGHDVKWLLPEAALSQTQPLILHKPALLLPNTAGGRGWGSLPQNTGGGEGVLPQNTGGGRGAGVSFNAVPRACRQVRVHEPPGSWWLRLICVLADETDQWLHGRREKEAALLCRNDRLVDGGVVSELSIG